MKELLLKVGMSQVVAERSLDVYPTLEKLGLRKYTYKLSGYASDLEIDGGACVACMENIPVQELVVLIPMLKVAIKTLLLSDDCSQVDNGAVRMYFELVQNFYTDEGDARYQYRRWELADRNSHVGVLISPCLTEDDNWVYKIELISFSGLPKEFIIRFDSEIEAYLESKTNDLQTPALKQVKRLH